MRRLWAGTVLLVFAAAGCAERGPSTYDPQAARSAIASALPTGWTLKPRCARPEVYDDIYFQHPDTDTFLLSGPQAVYLDVTDRENRTHRLNDGNEALVVWLMPADYKPRFPLPFLFYPPPPPAKVFQSRGLRVYATESREWAHGERDEQHLPFRELAGFAPVPFTVSWKDWKPDIASRLREATRPATAPLPAAGPQDPPVQTMEGSR